MRRGSIDKHFSTITSNTISWEGPNLPCINLCTGDMVSDVVYKVANELCKIKKELDLEDLDLKCIVDTCLSCPEPEKTLHTVLQLLINKVCSLEDIIENLQPGESDAEEKLITLASCFLPMKNSEGDPISKLPHSDYTRIIASKVCSILSDITSLESRLDITEQEIAVLTESINSLGSLPKISPVCVTPTNAPIPIDEVVELLEKQFCEIKSALGTGDKLLQGIGKQPDNLSTLPRLSGSGTMSSIPGWVNQVENVSDSIPNLWLTINDIRGAVKTMQDNCCKVNCDSIKIDFDVKINDEGLPVLYFMAKSKLPEGFVDCDPMGTKINISDDNGNEYYQYVKLSDAVKEFDGVEFASVGPVNINGKCTYTMNACLTNGSLTCQKCVNKDVFGEGCKYCEISVLGSHDGNVDGELVIIYE